jgi:hypothetical protein
MQNLKVYQTTKPKIGLQFYTIRFPKKKYGQLFDERSAALSMHHINAISYLIV